MRMTPIESINFFRQQEESSEEGLKFAKDGKNYFLLVLNAGELFKSQLMQGLIKWRMGESPVMTLNDAISSIIENASILQSIDGALNVYARLPIGAAAIVAFLLGRDFGLQKDFADIDAPDVRLDYLLALALYSGVILDDAGVELSRLAKVKGATLAFRSYRLYFDLLSGEKPGQSLEQLSDEAKNLFAARAKNGFYGGAPQTEGGDENNSIIVDYRLAAVFKKIGLTGNAHSWKWC